MVSHWYQFGAKVWNYLQTSKYYANFLLISTFPNPNLVFGQTIEVIDEAVAYHQLLPVPYNG